MLIKAGSVLMGLLRFKVVHLSNGCSNLFQLIKKLLHTVHMIQTRCFTFSSSSSPHWELGNLRISVSILYLYNNNGSSRVKRRRRPSTFKWSHKWSPSRNHIHNLQFGSRRSQCSGLCWFKKRQLLWKSQLWLCPMSSSFLPDFIYCICHTLPYREKLTVL